MEELYSTKDKQAVINRINTRYMDIVKQFGADNYYAKQYKSKMITLAGRNNLTAAGNIKRSAKVVSQFNTEDLKALEKAATAGAIKERVRQRIAERKGISPHDVSKEMLLDEIKQESDIREKMDALGVQSLSDAIADFRAKHNKPGGELSYEDFKNIIDDYENKTTKEREKTRATAINRYFSKSGKGVEISRATESNKIRN